MAVIFQKKEPEPAEETATPKKPRKKRAQGTPTLVGYHGLTVEEAYMATELLLNGKSPHYVANKIRTEWGKATEVTHQAVLQRVKHYRDISLAKGIVVAAARIDGDFKQGLFKRIEEDINILDDLRSLIVIQKRRVERAVHLEDEQFESPDRKSHYLRKDTGSSIRLLAELLGKAADLQFELGILKRAPKTLVSAQVSEETMANMTTKQVGPNDYQHRLLSIMDLVDQEMKAIDFPEGSVSEVEAPDGE